MYGLRTGRFFGPLETSWVLDHFGTGTDLYYEALVHQIAITTKWDIYTTVVNLSSLDVVPSMVLADTIKRYGINSKQVQGV